MERLKRLCYLQTFPAQLQISSPLLDQQLSGGGGASDPKHTEPPHDRGAAKPESEREKGGGRCLLKAWLSVYYKLKILPGLVWSRHEVGVGGG